MISPSKVDFCRNPVPDPGPHWWHASQKDERRRGHYFWNPDERWCYGPFAYEKQALEAQIAYEAGAPIPDFEDGESTI